MPNYLSFLLLIFYLAYSPIQAQNHPNLVFILVDDLGWKDLGFMGSAAYETPNLDRWSQTGTVFTQAYAGAANCAPSRAVLMSGQYPTRHGIYTVSPSTRGDAHARKLIPTPNVDHLSDSMLTLAEAFQQAGYRCGHVGKWHLDRDPLEQGFEWNRGGSGRGHPGKDGYFSPYNLDFLEDGPKGEYLSDRLTSEAIEFISAKDERPFFLYLPYYTVHTPLMGKPELREKYQVREPINGQGHQADYAAMVENMDHNVGRIFRTLDSLNLTQETIVVFSSDNGGIATVSRQWPLRAGKGSYYEGGIRVPFVVAWPGQIAGGLPSDLPLSFLDMYPTLLRLCGLELPAEKLLDGQDLSPYLLGKAMTDSMLERPLFWHFPIYLQAYRRGQDDARDPLFRTRPGTVMRQGKWKLHEYFEDGGLELYDLSQDPGERINLAKAKPNVAAQLHGIMQAWREAQHAPVPQEINPLYQPEQK